MLRNSFSGRKLIVLTVLVAGTVLSVSLFMLVRKWEGKRLEAEFIIRAKDRVEAIKNGIDNYLSEIYSVGDFYAASVSIERDEFAEFTKGILLRDPNIEALCWIPRVLDPERKPYEDAAHKQGYLGFEIKDYAADGKLIRAGKRPEYYPVYYVEPFKGNEIILGVDFSVDKARWQAMQEARDKDAVVVTEKIELLRPTQNDFGIRFFLPIYRNGLPHTTQDQRRENLVGFISTLFEVGQYIEASLSKLPPAGVNIYIYDGLSANKKNLIYTRLGRSLPRESSIYPLVFHNEIHWDTDFDVANHKWLISCYPTKGFFGAAKLWVSWFVLFVGLLFTILLARYLFGIFARVRYIESLVEERTTQLQETNKRLEDINILNTSLLATIPFGIDIVDEDGNIVFLNKRLEEKVGKLPISKKCWEVYKDDRMQCGNCPLLKGVIPGETEIIEVNGVFGGRVFQIFHTGMFYNGKKAILEVFQDVTEHKQLDKQISDLARFPAENPYPVLRISQDGKIMYANASCQLAMPEHKCEAGQYAPEPLRWLIMDAFNSQQIKRGVEIASMGRVFSFTLVPVIEGGYVNLYGSDITELKKAFAQLKKIDQLKSDFVSTVSHELRTPLTAIKEGVDIVIDGTAGSLNPKQIEFLNISKRNIDRLVRLINSILDFQRLESGKMVFIFAQHDLNAAVKEVKENMLPLALGKGLDIIVELVDSLPLVNFDYDKIMQVLTNLVSNAVKLTDKGGYIKITTVKGDNFVQVTVRDTGVGINPEDIPKLFHQFGQIEASSERRTGGTGLGLVISREIIEAHKGKIWVESEFGRGAAFHFILPLVERRI